MLLTQQRLTRFGQNLFIDVSALNFVRFTDDGQTAHLIFGDGATATIEGTDTAQMRSSFLQSSPVEGTPATALPKSDYDLAPPVVDGKENEFIRGLDERLHISGKKKAWFYGKRKDGKGVIIACANVGASCSMRLFDAETARNLGEETGSGRFQVRYDEVLTNAKSLTVESQPNLARDCKIRLPEPLFSELRKQIHQLDRS